MADTALADHIVTFGRVLRRAGLSVGSAQLIDALEAVDRVGVTRRADVHDVLRCVLVTRRDELPVFDEAFRLFWRTPETLPDLLQQALPSSPVPPSPAPGSARVRDALGRRPPPRAPRPPRDDEPEAVVTYSADEVFREKDFADFTAAELAAAKAALRQLRWPVAPRATRRRDRLRPGRRLDLRRTLRGMLRHHGEVVRLERHGPKQKPRPLVVLCDVSGSMERYARLLLHFTHALTNGLEQRVETFVFGTRLTRITRHLARRDVDEALRLVTGDVRDWSGGTRIGEALRAYNYTWLRRTLPSDGVVLVISDGWDRGDPEVLRAAMERLQRSCHRLIWLNPLLGYDGYEPLTRGIQAALPAIDDFLPVHNLASLDALAAHLTRLGARPRR